MCRPQEIAPIGNSDHCCIFWKPGVEGRTVLKKTTRKFSQKNLVQFGDLMHSTDWLSLVEATPIGEDSAAVLHAGITRLIDLCFPKRVIRFRNSDPPWIKPSLKMKIDDRDRAYSEGKRMKYLRLRNDVIKHTRYLKRIFIENASSTKKAVDLWSAIHMIGKSKKSKSSIQRFTAEEFSHFFTSVYSQSISESPFILPNDLPSMPLSFDPALVETLMNTLKRKSPGPDEVPSWVLKKFASDLAPAITCIFNQSVRQGIVPPCFKDANITPIPKCTNARQVSDFRPISLTPLLSKILEKLVVLNWILPFVKDKLDPSQFAYIPGPGKGTSTALTLLHHHILKFLDGRSGAVRVLSVDYAKAFDRLPHNVILRSACDLKLPRESLLWIRDFLSDRRQRVQISHSCSDWFSPPSGVPQGSVIGPLLFCMVIDGIKAVCTNSAMIKYADDLNVLHFIRDESEDELLWEWNHILEWSAQFGLPVNANKCAIMDVITKRGLDVANIPNVPSKPHLRILGVTFSCDLSWNEHVRSVVSKANKRMFILRNLRRAGCSSVILLRVYKSMILSLLTYCFPVFCNMPLYLKERLARVERRALRIVGVETSLLDAAFSKSCESLFNAVLGDDAHPLRELFLPRNPTVRNPCSLRPPLARTKRLKNSFLKYCPV